MKNNKIHWKISYVGLGSNQDDPIKQIENALVNIGKIERTQIIKKSSFYETEPVGSIDVSIASSGPIRDVIALVKIMGSDGIVSFWVASKPESKNSLA